MELTPFELLHTLTQYDHTANNIDSIKIPRTVTAMISSSKIYKVPDWVKAAINLTQIYIQ